VEAEINKREKVIKLKLNDQEINEIARKTVDAIIYGREKLFHYDYSDVFAVELYKRLKDATKTTKA